MHWAVPYIGKRWESGARGPDAYDCWGLVRAVYKDVFKIQLPEYLGISAAGMMERTSAISDEIAESWEKIQEPFDGCGVGMSQREVIHHVGIWTSADGGKVIHAWDGQNVVASGVWDLVRMKGIRKISFYRHKLWPS